MRDFFNRFSMITLTRIRDFQGIKLNNFDEKGNLSVGIKEHIVFPEVKPEESVVNFGLQVCFRTSAKSKKEAVALLQGLGLPIDTNNK